MPPETYTIPARPKTDAEHLERIAQIIFSIGFNWELVERRWPSIKNAFSQFAVAAVARADAEQLLTAEGMIKNRGKILRIIQNAGACKQLIEEHGSMASWVRAVTERHAKDPIFSKSLAEECRERFAGIGETTSGWLEYIFSKAKAKPQVCPWGQPPPDA